MNKSYAFIVDTGCDLPEVYRNREDVFVLPFHLIYDDEDFIDGVTITADEVYAQIPDRFPTTSLPSGEEVLSTLKAVQEAGYTKAFIITISSKLSGTCNMVRLIAKDYSDIELHVVDSKNISVGAGLVALSAIEQKEAGKSFDEVKTFLDYAVEQSKVMFTVGTLYYLKRGGRIGRVASLLGSTLRIQPIISCDDQGVYYTLAKARSGKQALQRICEEGKKFVQEHPRYALAFCHANVPERLQELKEMAKDLIEKAAFVSEGRTGAALGLNCGPDTVGFAVVALPTT